jgi:DNA-binding CsgD family transcriptional regulator
LEATFELDNLQVQVRGLPLREAQSLAYTVRGLSAKEAAKEMNISPRTVETYLDRTMASLNAANRANLIAQAVADGILVIKRIECRTRAVALCLICMLGLAIVPGAAAPDDFNRLSARSLRLRRRNEEYITLIDSTEDEAA